MSLIQALLNDPVPGEVWIALRPPEFRGQGTEQDPFNGATLATTPVNITGFSVGTQIPGTYLYTVTVTTATAHNLLTGDVVLIEGTSSYIFNSSFPVTYISATQFSCTVWTDPAPAAPTGGTCRKDPYLFDAVMRQIQQANVPVKVRIGPGVFQTKGYGIPSDQVSWRPISGMNLVGSGIGVTTLKLVGAYYDDRNFTIIGTVNMGGSNGAAYARIDDCSVSDMTLDCNQAGQPSTGVTCAAIFIRGSRTRIRRVRAINFGRGSLSQECFVIGVAGVTYETTNSSDGTDNVVEDCIIDSPDPSGVKETTCITSMSGEMAAGTGLNAGLKPSPVASLVRRCFIDCDYQSNPVDVVSTLVTVTTRMPHNLNAGDWFRMSGGQVLAISSPSDDVDNGSFKVEAVPAPTTYTFAYNPRPILAASQRVVGRWPSHRVGVTSVAVTKPNPLISKWVLNVTTSTPHYLVELEKGSGTFSRPSRVILEGLALPSGDPARILNGLPLWLTKWLGARSFQTEMTVDPNPGSTAPYYLGASNATLGVVFQGVSVGGVLAVMEQNQIRNCNKGGVYHDTFTSGDFICRDNYYSGVNAGPVQNLQGGLTAQSTVLTWTLVVVPPPVNTVAVTLIYPSSSQPHGFTVGQGILVTSFHDLPGHDAPLGVYNGSYVITAIPDSRSFTYELDYPFFDPDPTSAPKVQSLWENREAIIENNTIEIIPSAKASLPSVGISFYGALPPDDVSSDFETHPDEFSIFRRVVIRNNTIRYVSSVPMTQFGNGDVDVGIQVLWAENAIITNNLVDLTYDIYGNKVLDPIRQLNCKSVYYFKNTDAGGNLIQGIVQDMPIPGLSTKIQEVTTVVEEALALAFI